MIESVLKSLSRSGLVMSQAHLKSPRLGTNLVPSPDGTFTLLRQQSVNLSHRKVEVAAEARCSHARVDNTQLICKSNTNQI